MKANYFFKTNKSGILFSCIATLSRIIWAFPCGRAIRYKSGTEPHTQNASPGFPLLSLTQYKHPIINMSNALSYSWFKLFFEKIKR
jgi:hypothetical protein